MTQVNVVAASTDQAAVGRIGRDGDHRAEVTGRGQPRNPPSWVVATARALHSLPGHSAESGHPNGANDPIGPPQIDLLARPADAGDSQGSTPTADRPIVGCSAEDLRCLT
jgi:hypothetical protein